MSKQYRIVLSCHFRKYFGCRFRYGLILPNKDGGKSKPPIFDSSRNVFGDGDSDDEGESSKMPYNPGERLKKQALIAQTKVVSEDATIYQYDELYDDMERKKKEKYISTKEEKKPKYINKLLETADKRKRENERRVERQVQKERQEEGDKFSDKESFVTSAYKKKLEEMRLDEEKERRQQYLEEICDVSKQPDLGGFYRHLYDQQLNSKESLSDNENVKQDEEKSFKKVKNETEKLKRSYRKRSKTENTDHSDRVSEEEEDTVNIEQIKENKRQKTHLQSNIDADSDFSIDESSSEDDGTEKPPMLLIKNENDDENKNTDEPIKNSISESKGDFAIPDSKDEIKTVVNSDIEPPKIECKIDIWKKRTVGDVFDQALQRYYKRKSLRV